MVQRAANDMVLMILGRAIGHSHLLHGGGGRGGGDEGRVSLARALVILAVGFALYRCATVDGGSGGCCCCCMLVAVMATNVCWQGGDGSFFYQRASQWG
jgi:hypothetical protein